MHHGSAGIVKTTPVRRLVALAAIKHPSETITADEIEKLVRNVAHRFRMPQLESGDRRSWKRSTRDQLGSHILVRVTDRLRADRERLGGAGGLNDMRVLQRTSEAFSGERCGPAESIGFRVHRCSITRQRFAR
jgi:hypothetical protein